MGADWVTTNYLLTTMSRLVSSLMLLSLMVMVVVVNTKPEPRECPRGFTRTSDNKECEKIPCHPNCHIDLGENPFQFKREADAPMAHKTKRGSSSRRISSSRKSSSSSSSRKSSSSSRKSSSGRK